VSQLQRVLIVLLVFALFAGASGAAAQDDTDLPEPCSAVDVPEVTLTGEERREITLFLGYVPNVQFAPLYVAAEKGYFEDFGIDISFEYGDENVGVERLAANDLQFAIVSGEQVVLGRAREMPLVYVFEWYQRFAVGVVAPVDQEITEPADMAGHKIGIPGRYGASWTGFVALLDAVGLTEDDLGGIEPIGFAATQTICAGLVDAAVVYISNEPVQIRETCSDVDVIPVADYVDLVANGLVTNEQTLANDPELVWGMVYAFARGVFDTIENPDEAYTLSRAHVETLAEDDPIQREVLQNSLAFWDGDIGRTRPASWTFTMQTLLGMELLDEPVDLSGACTNGFLPQSVMAFIDNQDEVEQWIGAPLPDEATNVYYDSFTYFGYVLWLRFDVPAGPPVLDDFIGQLGFDVVAEFGDGINPFADDSGDDDPEWWLAKDAEEYTGGGYWQQGDAQPKRHFEMLVDRSDPDVWTVYLRVYDDL
jgi:NitT/TauT family transport system substrate-binding protein